MAGSQEFSTFDIKGISIAAVDLTFASQFICQHAPDALGEYVTVTGAHGIVESVYDERVRTAFTNALMAVPDGMPLVWLGRRLGFRSMTRVYGPDLMEKIFATAQYRGLKHYFYGAEPSVISKLEHALRVRFGEFNSVGSYSPAIKALGFTEDETVIARIRDLKPDLIWVSLSCPKQEVWMQMHMPKINSGIGIGVGAAFNLLSGTLTQAPRWMQRSGLEWLFRLLVEPRRLFKRYLFIIPRFLCFLIAALVKRRHTPLGGAGRQGSR